MDGLSMQQCLLGQGALTKQYAIPTSQSYRILYLPDHCITHELPYMTMGSNKSEDICFNEYIKYF